jgi:hypothetical protein
LVYSCFATDQQQANEHKLGQQPIFVKFLKGYRILAGVRWDEYLEKYAENVN